MDDTKPEYHEADSVPDTPWTAKEGRVLKYNLETCMPDDFTHEVTTPLPAMPPYKRMIVKRIRKRRIGRKAKP